MTAIDELNRGKTSYLSDFDLFERAAPGRQNAWLARLRRKGMERFDAAGFPSRKNEDWQYTNVAPLAGIPFRLAGKSANGVRASNLRDILFGEIDCCNLVFVNGSYSEKLSSSRSLPRGVCVGSLRRALEERVREIEPYLARHAEPEANPFTALNTAFIDDGAYLCIADDMVLEDVIHLVYISTGQEANLVCHPRNLIRVGAGSRVSVVESYVGLNGGVSFTNAVTEMVMEEGAAVDHYKLQREGGAAFHIATLQANLEQGCSFSSHFVSLGGALTRNDVRAVLAGEGSECTLNGLYVAKGRQHMDSSTCVDHAKPHSSSRQLYKGVLDDDSTAAFSGRVVVRTDAQKTSALQSNRNLLLSESALVDTRPQLEIYADDVKCTHGATIGKLDEDSLFYLRSRGIGEDAARTLLTYAFASEVIGAMKIKPIQCQMDLVLLARLARDAATEVP